jgi:demethylmenaquinone methyltransferase/2-methoxy-6-polyprenyl-1,4-benzoquinol methylase
VATESSKKLVSQFFGHNARSYDKVVSLTTFGRDSYWKKEIIEKISRCDSILDLACGTGILTFKIAEKFPAAKITGVDITNGYLNIAKDKLKLYHKISFLHYDVEKMTINDAFDCIASSYIPKYCNPQILIDQCLHHLNPGGKIILHDFVYPKNRLVRSMWDLYFAILNIAGFFVPSWKEIFRNLPKLIRSTNWVERYRGIMEKNGLKVEVRFLTLGTSAILTGTKKV